MHQCQQCAKERWDWRNCPGSLSWFPPSAIFYCPKQVEWIIEHFNILDQKWPDEPLNTGYYDPGGGRRISPRGYFEIPRSIKADIEKRLDRCGKDGSLTRQCLAEGWDDVTLAGLMGKSVYVIRDKIRRVINYCSGARIKRISYYEFSRRKGIGENYRR